MGYTFHYCSKRKHKRAAAEVGILINNKYERNIEETYYINERIMRVLLNLGERKLHIVSVPDAGKLKEDTTTFYEQLQQEIDKIFRSKMLLILGDLNTRIGNEVVSGVKQRFNEPTLNENGKAPITFCAENELRVNNTYFNHKSQYKTICSNSRVQTSSIDCAISNRTIHPSQILDIRTLTSANIGSDH